jgi:lipopolysaccharide transport system permease protein
VGLVWTLVRTDFKTRYHGTGLGFGWALLKPVAMFVVLQAIFSFVFSAEPDYRLNLIIGLFLWEFFSQATTVGLGSLQAKAFLLAKVKFPAWIIVATSVSNAVVTLGVFAVIILGSLAGNQELSLVRVALFAWYLLHFVAIVLGISLGTSVLFLRFRDLNQVWEVILQAGFFVAPIIYPVSILPEAFHKYLYLWPPTPVIQFSRTVLTTAEIPTAAAHLYLTIEAIAILGLGSFIYRRRAPRVAEQL